MEIFSTKRIGTKKKDAKRNRERKRNNKRRKTRMERSYKSAHKDKREKGKENPFICPYQWRAKRKVTKHII